MARTIVVEFTEAEARALWQRAVDGEAFWEGSDQGPPAHVNRAADRASVKLTAAYGTDARGNIITGRPRTS